MPVSPYQSIPGQSSSVFGQLSSPVKPATQISSVPGQFNNVSKTINKPLALPLALPKSAPFIPSATSMLPTGTTALTPTLANIQQLQQTVRGLQFKPKAGPPAPSLSANLGSVLGASDTNAAAAASANPFQLSDLSQFYSTLGGAAGAGSGSGGGGGGGGGGGFYDLANQKQKLFDQEKAAALQQVAQQYEDLLNDLTGSQQRVEGQAQKTKDLLAQQLSTVKTEAEGNRLANQDKARQNYQDLQTQSRRQARAVGGASSSGFMELSNKLDQTLQRNLTSADTDADSVLNKAQLSAQSAINDLENNLNENIAKIEGDKRTAARERDRQKQQIEQQAAQQALQVQEWLMQQRQKAAAGSSVSAAQKAAQAKQGILSAYITDLSRAQQAGVDPKTIQAAYLPQLASAGVGASDIVNYSQLAGFNTQPSITDYQALQMDAANKRALAGSLANQGDVGSAFNLLGIDPSEYGLQF